MKEKLGLILGHSRIIYLEIKATIVFLKRQFVDAKKKNRLRVTFKLTYRTFRDSLQNFRKDFENSIGMLDGIKPRDLVKYRSRVGGLHQLLPDSSRFSYSILIPVYKPNPAYFEKALQSALDQTAPHFEILLGYDGEQPQEIYDVVARLKETDIRARTIIKEVHCDRGKTGGGISATTNEIASVATGKYFVFMDHDDWIRPDLLYRYELTLRLSQFPENVVLYCNEYKINERDEIIASSYFEKPEQPVFPYLFINFICHCLMVPRGLFHKIGGLRKKCDGAQDYDLCLRLDLAGAKFQNVPLYLYAWRSHEESTAKKVAAKDYATPAGILALTDYIAGKGLNWENPQQGYIATTYRATPRISKQHKVQVVMPYKDNEELTLKAVRSLKEQILDQFTIHISCVDNGSKDFTIADKLKAEGIEVLRVDEPFNFSRLNNYAIQNTRFKECDLILLMNNDVELQSDALVEMVRWIDQPNIGIVGCRLHWPNQLLQHGGVTLSKRSATLNMGYFHHEVGVQFENLGFARVLGVTDAVTAACALIHKDLFLQVGGFDEIWYPIAYSDTDLVRKIRRLGYVCFYTPYAVGIHYESQSRGYMTQYEEMERSRWLFMQLENKEKGNSFYLSHSAFDYPNSSKESLAQFSNLKVSNSANNYNMNL